MPVAHSRTKRRKLVELGEYRFRAEAFGIAQFRAALCVHGVRGGTYLVEQGCFVLESEPAIPNAD